MSKLKIITSKEMCKLLGQLNFSEERQKGSHKFFSNNNGKTTVVPMHAKDIDRALIRKMLNDIELSIDEYNSMV